MQLDTTTDAASTHAIRRSPAPRRHPVPYISSSRRRRVITNANASRPRSLPLHMPTQSLMCMQLNAFAEAAAKRIRLHPPHTALAPRAHPSAPKTRMRSPLPTSHLSSGTGVKLSLPLHTRSPKPRLTRTVKELDDALGGALGNRRCPQRFTRRHDRRPSTCNPAWSNAVRSARETTQHAEGLHPSPQPYTRM